MKEEKISIRISAECKEILCEIAKRENKSISQIVQEAIDDSIDQYLYWKRGI